MQDIYNNLDDQRAIKALRIASIELVDRAGTGHPGMPLGVAPVIHTLWTRHLRHNPQKPTWFNRDRFIMSAGHASALLYANLYLWDYDISKEDLFKFRRFNSLTPGHPEYDVPHGIEMTTGPLGQGVSSAVGIAMGEKYIASQFNREDIELTDFYTYVITSDGEMMEGVASEAASLAGHLKLDKLIVFYDDNKITLDGSTDLTFSEDVQARYEAYGWHVVKLNKNFSIDELDSAIVQAKGEKNKPSLIICPSDIGFGSPLMGQSASHGSPLGAENVKLTKQNLEWPLDEKEAELEFSLVKKYYSKIATCKKDDYEQWAKLRHNYNQKYPDASSVFSQIEEMKVRNISLDSDMFNDLPQNSDATRNTSHYFLQKLADYSPLFLGGSADLASSNKTILDDYGDFQPDNWSGRNIHYGVREHGMAAISNGLALVGLRPFCATFMVFSDYMRGAMRLSAIMDLPIMFIMTHDSIAIGEDGATHQPVEQLANIRSLPNIDVWRPADINETAAAYITVWNSGSPGFLALSRQDLPCLESSSVKQATKGGYVLYDSTEKESEIDIIFLSTGSEVSLVLNVAKQLVSDGFNTRVVSLPCIEQFLRQDVSYIEQVLPPSIKTRLAVEAGSAMPWFRFVDPKKGAMITQDQFGASAPPDTLLECFGFSELNVKKKALELLKQKNQQTNDYSF